MSKIVKTQKLGSVEQVGAHKRAPAVLLVCFVEDGPSFLALSLRSPPGQFDAAGARDMAALLCKGADILDAKTNEAAAAQEQTAEWDKYIEATAADAHDALRHYSNCAVHNAPTHTKQADAAPTDAAEDEADVNRREDLAEILKTVEADGLKGPRDLDVALDAIEALFNTERYKVQSYLSRCLQTLYPNIEPLPDLLGVCTQIDNALTGQQAEITLMLEALEKLARLGAEPYYGNSEGNTIALAAMRKAKNRALAAEIRKLIAAVENGAAQ
jgi:hypothetical protein